MLPIVHRVSEGVSHSSVTVSKASPGKGELNALVPGCGRGYDVSLLAHHGYKAVGLDLSPTAVRLAQEHHDARPATEQPSGGGEAHFVLGSFYEHTPPEGGYDLLFDYTFLCAMHPEARDKWADTYVKLIKRGTGRLVTAIFPIVEKPDGPPFAMTIDLVRNLLEPRGFVASGPIEMLPDDQVHPGREGKTALAIWTLP